MTPLTPPECDLRDYPWMPIDCTRLLTSETWILGSSDEKVAALTLWCKSWHQVPAGSLPSHDRMLAVLSEAGGAWNRVREHALRGWIECADGRLYHPVVCEKANEAWGLKQSRKARTESARAAKADRRGSLSAAPHAPVTTSVTEPVTRPVTETVTGSNGTDSTRPDQNRPSKGVEDAPRSASPPRQAKAFRLPADWQPSEPEYAGVDPHRTLARFRDYWTAQPGQRGVKADWQATWRNWCRREADQPKQKLHTQPPAEQDRRILAAVGLNFDDPEPAARRIAQ